MKTFVLFLSLICFLAMTETAYADGGFICPSESKLIQLQNKMHLIKSQYEFYQRDCARIEDSLAQAEKDGLSSLALIESLQVCMNKVHTYQDQMLENLKAQKCRPAGR